MKLNDIDKANEERDLTCPHCGHNRFQRHERGVFKEGGYFEIDEVAVQCLKCLRVSLQTELNK